MTSKDPITALADQLAACGEQLTQLDAREAAHYTALTALLTSLAQPGPGAEDPGGDQPGPPPPWWNLTPDDRHEPVARLRGWVEQVYQPGYGHLAATLGPCWPAHDLCLYGLDILAELWSALYLQPRRTPALLSAQAEYQARHPARPGLPSSGSKPPTAATPAPPSPSGARHDRRHPPPGARLRPPRLAGLPLPARPEDPRHHPRLPRRHHR